MGGLDSRYILSPANPDRIGIPTRFVTSISSPHHGTPIADLAEHAVDLIPFPHLPFSTADPFQTILDKLGISRDGMRELKAVYCQQIFNSKYVDAPESHISPRPAPGGRPFRAVGGRWCYSVSILQP
jgi:triacylglycerol lipase